MYSASHWGPIEALLTEDDMKNIIRGKTPILWPFFSGLFGLNWGVLWL